ncbi:hypothetical protein O181_120084, partial [Austropuccinia psidii MF-1]|nr:hypothetical protein [Austropuccinia psidii MF-1]
VWTSPDVTAYMEVTAYFIDQQYPLKLVLIGLNEIQGDHTGTSLEKIFLDSLKRYTLEDRMVCIMTDNASVNHQMVHEISGQISTFSAKALGNSSPVESSTKNKPRGPIDLTSLIDSPEGLNFNYNSIISWVARLALYLHQSPQQCKRFITTVKLVYNDTTLLSHFSIHWNSTYDIIEKALPLKDAYNQNCTLENMQAY